MLEQKLATIDELATRRKKTSDELASQVFELTQQIQTLKKTNTNDLDKLAADTSAKHEAVVTSLRKEIRELVDARKQGELMAIDSNRRLDQLLQENKTTQKVRCGIYLVVLISESRHPDLESKSFRPAFI